MNEETNEKKFSKIITELINWMSADHEGKVFEETAEPSKKELESFESMMRRLLVLKYGEDYSGFSHFKLCPILVPGVHEMIPFPRIPQFPTSHDDPEDWANYDYDTNISKLAAHTKTCANLLDKALHERYIFNIDQRNKQEG